MRGVDDVGDGCGLTAADRDELEARGIGWEEARRQLARLNEPQRSVELVRPARLGDGIVPMPAEAEGAELADIGRAALRSRRFVRFVPASGAASRLFADLRAALTAGAGEDADGALERFERLELGRLLGADPATVLALHGEAPKAVIPFHLYPDGERRSALEEHLVEAAATVAGAGSGLTAVHFTVASSHRSTFDALLAERLPVLERRLGCRFDVTFSEQSPSTDSLAVDAEGRPFRVARSPGASLLLRPGGHGALLGNLQTLFDDGFELVAMKNIDNVQPESRQAEAVGAWHRLAGIALRMAEDSSRPVRVCGVVRRVGDAGGAPFWVRGASGAAELQIVEASEVDVDHPEQAAIFDESTHFNPVFLVCAAALPGGGAYRLADYADAERSFLVEKSHDGRPLRSLERPGLWNGSMAGWETRFVELPLAVYTPVKTVFDLAAPAHRLAGGEG